MASLEERLRILENGLILTRYYVRKRPEKLTFKVRLHTGELIWIRSEGQVKPDGTVDLRELKEVRPKDPDDKETKEFDKWLSENDRNNTLCFSLHYGHEFVLKHLSLQAQTPDQFDIFINSLEHLRNAVQNAPFSVKIDRWLHKEFYELRGRHETITLADIKKWLSKSYYRLGANKLREYCKECNINPDALLSFQDFARIYQRIMHPSKLFGDYFSYYTRQERLGGQAVVGSSHLAEFLLSENQESIDPEGAARLIMESVDNHHTSEVSFTKQEFLNYLFSTDNSIWNEETTQLYQDMDHPLSHYFIASSHNTYLQGDQFMSNSSVEAYIQCLRMGARCIELDCWDGADGNPQIFHGRTLTSKIKFYDVVKGIKKYAWQHSEFPIILSIENHCSINQQKKMAEVFREVLGDELLTAPVDKAAERLPSPNQLRRKFILKHKKIGKDWKLGHNEEDVIEMGEFSHSDISQSRRTGLLYLQDPVNKEEWNQHFFMLSRTGLYFTDQTSLKKEDDDDDNHSLAGLEINGNLENIPLEQRHLYEPWYHGRLPDGRSTGDELLKAHQHLGPATFLVRESDTFPGSYTLSFWQHDKANHCRIKSRNIGGRVKYFLVENLVFDSLYELIEFYKHNKLRSQNFELCLREPVPKIPSPRGKEWYHENLGRKEAEEWLARIPKDGAFLIRKRGSPPDVSYAISFRAENKIKHCRIIPDTSSFSVGTATFDSLPELVAYYQKRPLYRNMKLRYPVNKALVDKCGESDASEVSIYGCGIYTQPNEVQTSSIQCRALYDREPERMDELRLTKGDMIVNVIKKTPDWWQGEIGDQTLKWFPSNHVEQIEDGLGSLQQGSVNFSRSIQCVPKGTLIASTSDSIEKKRLYWFELQHDDSEIIKIAADTAEEVKDWMLEIKQCTEEAFRQSERNKELQKKFQIAQEFSDLVIYCRSTRYDPEAKSSYYEMSSFSELKAEKICAKKDNKGKQYMNYNMHQMSRVYPKGQRIDSSNYDPIFPWSCGAHLLALNYQTPDKSMQINQGRFMQNGLCGYVHQPRCLNDTIYDPFQKRSLANVDPMTISLIILGGRHLLRSGKGIPCPFVEVEILGAYYEDTKKFKTEKKTQNALAPVWNEATDFDIVNPQLAMIRFCVQDEDVFGDPNFLGQATIPVSCIKSGYRSIPLLNEYSEELELASLLVKIEIVNPNETEYSSIYSVLSDLREEKRTIEESVFDAADKLQQTALQQKLMDVNSRIDEQLDHRRKRSIADKQRKSRAARPIPMPRQLSVGKV
ncbi:1-phosphatidylinositol 4,5-bisphosphate phosphodiesterase gamma-1-like [Watersipora subatra]|uniref:1-phosphatidylinositol 4,5-bisphosphate phosphodiesterase gamma-1-like n=1 Tax=Watersipora subatra TaxID=2589382 RepID=UPI00355B8B11